MSLLWCDGFEGYGTSNNSTPSPTDVLADKYDAVDRENQMAIRDNAAAVRTDWAVRLTSITYNSYLNPASLTSNATLIAGVAVNIPLLAGWSSTDDWPLFAFKNGAGEICAELVCAHASFYVKDAAGAYLGGVRGVIEIAEFNYIEMKVYGHATNGTIEVRINNCPVFNATSVNTQATSGIATRACLGDATPPVSAEYARLDDFYVCDGSGSDNNDFLGDVIVKTLWPSGDDSVNFASTGNANYSTHYEQVNYGDSLPTTDWVRGNAAGQRDIFTLDNLTVNFSDIHGVAAWAYAKYNGTETESANFACTKNSTYDKFIVENDPDTSSAWTNNSINALKSGFEVQ
jgi:hypothetical protein